MKKHFLTLALLFGVIICYGGNHASALDSAAENGISQEAIQRSLAIAGDAGLTAIWETVLEAGDMESCKLHFKGTIDGKEVEFTVEFEGISCKELLKALVAAF